MRATTSAGLLLAGLAACLGAALVTRTPAPPAQPPLGQAPQTPFQTSIDRSVSEPLTVQRAPAATGVVALDHVRTLVGFGPRYPGLDPAAPAAASGDEPAPPASPPPRRPTPGWSQQLTYIEQVLQQHGLTVRRDTWTDRRERITFTNLMASIPGPRKERIVLACHHDTKCTQGHTEADRNFHFVGANDGASAVGLILALVPALQELELEATVELVFFDGEESLDWAWNDGARALFGSKRFVKRHRDALLLGEEPRVASAVLLDMVGRTDLHIQEELYSTTRLRQLLWSAAVATGHQQQFFQRAEAASDDHKPFLDVGIPGVDLIDLNGNPHWHKVTDTLENLSAESLQKVADVVLTLLPAIDREYVIAPK
jgi:glutaminyl-peptide cyclotransferase